MNMPHNADLSAREQQVAALLLQGKSNKEIALALGISDRTVEFHLKNIYAKLHVRSRTEAVLSLGKSTGPQPALSTVAETGENTDNDGEPIPTRRLPMKNMLYGFAALLVITLVFVVAMANLPARGTPATSSPTASATPLPSTALPSSTPQPAVSARAHILEQIRQAVAAYQQNVQAEKKHGTLEVRKDPQTGAELVFFTGNSETLIRDLNEKLWETINSLEPLYVQVYRDETRPTPYPTRATAAENKAYYEELLAQAGPDCLPATAVPAESATTFPIYSPDEGKDLPMVFDDRAVRCAVAGQMIEEFRIAPMLAKVDKAANMALVRQALGQPDLVLTYTAIATLANSPWRSAAVYVDDAGTRYSVDVDTAHLAQIEPGGQSHPDIPAAQARSLDELRGIARQFAQTNSPNLSQLQSVLSYQEGGKSDIYFFTWTYKNKDWSGTDWAMMPPFLQIGVLTNGQIYTYIDTLDLYK
jgi:DNA-binding CsgD family transcriptional regulator